MVKYLKTLTQLEVESNYEQNERTIHLSDIDLETTELEIEDLFRSIDLKPSKIIKLPFSSFAYVTLETFPIVKFLLEDNFELSLNNKKIRILPFSQSNNFDPNANLIIKNLETYLNEKNIIDRFKVYGEILSCKLVRDCQGESKCYAYLQYKHRSSALEAIDNLNNTYWDEKYDPDFLYQKYKQSMFYLKQNQQPVDSLLSNYQDVFGVNNKVLHGKKLYVGIFKKKDDYFRIKKEKEGKPSNLYVKNFGPNFGDRDLFNLFKTYGSIKSAKVRRQRFGIFEKPLGCGFVDFEEPEEAEKARLGLNGYVLKNSGRVISVTYADCKSRRMRKKLEDNDIENNEINNNNHSINIMANKFDSRNNTDLTTSINSDLSQYSDIETPLNSSFDLTHSDDDLSNNRSSNEFSDIYESNDTVDDDDRDRSESTCSDSSFDSILMDWSERWNRQVYSEYKLF